MRRGPYLSALHHEQRTDGLEGLTEAEWREALKYADRSRLTLALARIAGSSMPPWVRERIDSDAAKNRERLAKLEAVYRSVKAQLDDASVEFLALKGLAHCPEFGFEAAERVQYDIDLYTPRERVLAARDALLPLGYESLEAMERFPTDHLPALIRKTGWEWRGDFFDPEIPFAVELHFRFWDRPTSRLQAEGVEQFWERRISREVGGVSMGALAPPDALAFASLHLLKHVLLRSANPAHVLEIARFLELRKDDAAFWREWSDWHPAELRRLQGVVFRLAAEWFGCAMAEEAAEASAELPAATREWFDEFKLSPAAAPFHSAKDELWLHLSLLSSKRDRLAVARRRLLPMQLPGPVSGVYVPDSQLTLRKRIARTGHWLVYSASRLRLHLSALVPTARTGARLWWRAHALPGNFWNFLASAILFNLALFIFVLLYNLRLIGLGFHEDFIGAASSASTWGCVAGTIPAAAVARRFGLRFTLTATIALIATLECLRALATTPTPLLVFSFIYGVVFSAWAVVMSPLVAASAPAERRASAYSFFFACMFSTGIVGGWLGGRLPGWIGSTRASLLLAAGVCGLALLPALRLTISVPAPAKKDRIYPRSPFLARFLAFFAIWNLATASFNPFFNAYFQRLHYSTGDIGNVYSLTQLAQTATVLLAPLILRWAGIARGIGAMMLATAFGLLALAAQSPGMGAAFAYGGYMVFQWMSEPGLTTLLMNNVAEGEREGAAALNYLVAFTAQGIAAFVAGRMIAALGYGPVLAGAAGIAVLAAGLFATLRR